MVWDPLHKDSSPTNKDVVLKLKKLVMSSSGKRLFFCLLSCVCD